ncbi:unnamed protein product [Amoebophrya sp. A120]|nr:unnamed protein product [Amoebophrya sp. A120]|eukprot:GSA120T00009770001.1
MSAAAENVQVVVRLRPDEENYADGYDPSIYHFEIDKPHVLTIRDPLSKGRSDHTFVYRGLKKEEAAAQSIANRTKFAAMHFTLTLVDWKDLANAGFDIRSWTNADFDFDRRRRGGHSSNARWDDETGGVHRGKKIFDGWTVIGSDEYDYDQRRRNLPHGPRLYFRLVFKPPAGN